MSVNTVGSFLNIRDSHLRVVSGNVYATAMNIGGINVDVAQGLQSVTNQGNVTSNTLQFSNATTAFVTTGNVSVGRDLTVTGNTLVSSNLTVTGNVLVSDDLTVTGNVAMDTDTLFVNATTSNVGIGTVTPGYTLDVAGDINFSGTFNQNGAPFVSSPWTKTGADLSYTTGNVSVGKDLTVTGFVGNSGTGAILVPSGTTAQQPAGVNGMLRYNTETGYMEAYTVSGWSVIATPPSITSFDITNVAVAAVITDTITVSGSGFDAITNIQLRGADGKNYDTTTFTFTDSGSIGFKIGTLATGQLANRPFKVVATNGAGLSATSSTTLGLGGVTWLSPAASSINEFAIGVSTSLTLSAYDGVGGSAVTYTLQSGSYLSGTFTLSGTTITGTTDAAENTTSSVTIRATDNADSSVFLDRTFTLKAVPDALYPFTSPFTFSSPYTTSFYTGPTLGQVRAIYTGSASAWTQATSPAYLTMGHYTGVQDWTVPQTGSYTITAAGSCGGNHYLNNPTNSGYGGHGKSMTGTFTLTKGEVLRIIAGKNGQHDAGYNSANGGSGGGGGSFVSRGDTLLIAGGAGGGASLHNNGSYSNGEAGSASTSGTNSKSGHAGGSGGSDGTGGLNGKGWNSIKTNPTGQSASGGFGGGGTWANHGGGGGGGYSGGGGGSSSGGAAGNSYGNGGGGGGSYNSGTNQSSGGIYPGPGYVTVTLNP